MNPHTICVLLSKDSTWMLKRAGMKNMKEFFKSLSASSSTYGGYSPIKYYCMSCGKEHKEIACPNCGSKMKRAG
jgi:rubrerythrin